MHEEIDYAEMLEIPVSTVNVIKKTNRRKKSKTELNSFQSLPAPSFQGEKFTQNPLRDSVIAQVNDKLGNANNVNPDEFSPEYSQEYSLSNGVEQSVNGYENTAVFPDADPFDNRLDFDPIPERIDTVRLYSREEKPNLWARFLSRIGSLNFLQEKENDGGRVEMNIENTPNAVRIALNTEFVAACVLCGVIFLTNVFMPNSAFNTFFRSIGEGNAAATDTRTYSDFTLSPVVSMLSKAQLNLSPTGVLSFTEEGCVYPAADGKVATIEKAKDGTHLVKISYSDSFTGVISGLDYVYYAVGDDVKANVPLGYSDGDAEVQVTMYSDGVLLNCFQLTEENCLAWLEND